MGELKESSNQYIIAMLGGGMWFRLTPVIWKYG